MLGHAVQSGLPWIGQSSDENAQPTEHGEAEKDVDDRERPGVVCLTLKAMMVGSR
jgi:hypothetical protein